MFFAIINIPDVCLSNRCTIPALGTYLRSGYLKSNAFCRVFSKFPTAVCVTTPESLLSLFLEK